MGQIDEEDKDYRYESMVWWFNRKYENLIEHERDMGEGEVLIVNMWKKPENFCYSACENKSQFVTD